MGGLPDTAAANREALRRIATSQAILTGLAPAGTYRGIPMGIDALRVIERGLTPVFNTGIAHATPGVGQIGAGYGRVPIACFEAALAAQERVR